MNTTPSSVKTAAYVCFAQAVLMIIGLCALNYIVSRIFNVPPGGKAPRLGLVLIVVTALSYCITPLMALLFTVLGIGLLKRWSWARMATIVVSIADGILTFPIGTIFAVIIIVQLNKPEAKATFLRPAAPPMVPPAVPPAAG